MYRRPPLGIPADQIMALTQRCAQAEVDRDKARARVAELEEGISTAMQLIEGGFDSAAYEALEALNAHK